MDENLKKKEILLSATNCFLRYGYAKTTMVDIGKGAGLNKASLYYYYKDKISIFKEVYLSEYNKYNNSINEKILTKVTFTEKINSVIEELIDFNNGTCNSFQLTPDILKTLKDDTKEVFDNIKKKSEDKFTQFINEGIKVGEFEQYSKENIEEIAGKIIMIIDSFLNINCPLFLSPKEREETYEKVKKDVVFTVTLMLKGITIKK